MRRPVHTARFKSIASISVVLLVFFLPVIAFAHDGDEGRAQPPSPGELKAQKVLMGFAGVLLLGAGVWYFKFRGRGGNDRWQE